MPDVDRGKTRGSPRSRPKVSVRLLRATRTSIKSFRSSADSTSGRNTNRPVVGLDVERESSGRATQRHHLVCFGRHGLLRFRPSRRIRLKGQIIGGNHSTYRSRVVAEQRLMTHKPGKAAVAKHLVELRREAVAALKRFNTIAERLNFYQRYLALSKTHSVRLAGPFLVIKGGQPADRTGTDSD